MAKNNATQKEEKPRIKRKGVHAKSKNSSNKRSKNYRKAYKGQGR